MKKLTILTIAISMMLVACNETKKTEEKRVDNTEQNEHKETQTIDESHLNNAWTDVMVLNDNKKWTANKETNQGVVAMLSLIRNDKSSTAEGYKKLGNALNKEKNMIIKECTMKGESHDNLHVFLMPLIDKVELLQNTVDKETGDKIKANLLEHMELYDIYFE